MSQLRTISNRFIVGILILKKTPKECDAGDLPNFFYLCLCFLGCDREIK